MQRVYNRTTAEEQRWIVRVILKGTVGTVVAYSDSLIPNRRHGHIRERDYRLRCLPPRRAGFIQHMLRSQESCLGTLGPQT